MNGQVMSETTLRVETSKACTTTVGEKSHVEQYGSRNIRSPSNIKKVPNPTYLSYPSTTIIPTYEAATQKCHQDVPPYKEL
jgi:hypothetical protein